MAEVKLNVNRRNDVGKGAARRSRAAGRVPAVVYGHGMEPTSVDVDRREFLTALHTDAGLNVLLDLQLDGQELLALTKEIQRDPVRGTVLHADFIKVDRQQEVEVEVPLHLVGNAPGVAAGGVLEHPLFTVQVRSKATDVPEAVEADVSTLEIGDSLRVGGLAEGRTFQILNDPDTVVASVVAPISAAELEAMESAVAPEAGAPAEMTEAAGEQAGAAGVAAEDAPPERQADPAQE